MLGELIGVVAQYDVYFFLEPVGAQLHQGAAQDRRVVSFSCEASNRSDGEAL